MKDYYYCKSLNNPISYYLKDFIFNFLVNNVHNHLFTLFVIQMIR